VSDRHVEAGTPEETVGKFGQPARHAAEAMVRRDI